MLRRAIACLRSGSAASIFPDLLAQFEDGGTVRSASSVFHHPVVAAHQHSRLSQVRGRAGWRSGEPSGRAAAGTPRHPGRAVPDARLSKDTDVTSVYGPWTSRWVVQALGLRFGPLPLPLRRTAGAGGGSARRSWPGRSAGRTARAALVGPGRPGRRAASTSCCARCGNGGARYPRSGASAHCWGGPGPARRRRSSRIPPTVPRPERRGQAPQGRPGRLPLDAAQAIRAARRLRLSVAAARRTSSGSGAAGSVTAVPRHAAVMAAIRPAGDPAGRGHVRRPEQILAAEHSRRAPAGRLRPLHGTGTATCSLTQPQNLSWWIRWVRRSAAAEQLLHWLATGGAAS